MAKPGGSIARRSGITLRHVRARCWFGAGTMAEVELPAMSVQMSLRVKRWPGGRFPGFASGFVPLLLPLLISTMSGCGHSTEQGPTYVRPPELNERNAAVIMNAH